MTARLCRFNFEAWDELGEAAARELMKGTQVHVTGRLRSRTYVNKENQQVTYDYINVNQINRVDGVSCTHLPVMG